MSPPPPPKEVRFELRPRWQGEASQWRASGRAFQAEGTANPKSRGGNELSTFQGWRPGQDNWEWPEDHSGGKRGWRHRQGLGYREPEMLSGWVQYRCSCKSYWKPLEKFKPRNDMILFAFKTIIPAALWKTECGGRSESRDTDQEAMVMVQATDDGVSDEGECANLVYFWATAHGSGRGCGETEVAQGWSSVSGLRDWVDFQWEEWVWGKLWIIKIVPRFKQMNNQEGNWRKHCVICK